ncbi:MAG TPA: YncE family protein [Usitatibacter sp.]|nr:YncE family protein [Usitatibacter sp.]
MRNFFVPEGLLAGYFRALATAGAVAACAVHADPFAFVPLQGDAKVAVVDLGAGAVVNKLDVGNEPMGIAFNPVSNRAYVTNTDDGTVTIIDTTNQTIVGTSAVGPTPMGIAVSPSGKQVAVATMGASSSSPSNTITILGGALLSTITVGTAPSAVAYNPAGSFLYVANYGDGTVSVVNVATSLAVNTIPVGDSPIGLIVNPAGTKLYVLHGNGSLGLGFLSVVDLAQSKVVSGFRLNGTPNAFAMNAAGTRIVLAKPQVNTVSLIDTTSDTLQLDIQMPGGTGPTSANFSPDGKTIYVLGGSSGMMLQFDATTYLPLETINLKSSSPTALGYFIQPATNAANSPDVLSGLWWNPSESGWGIHFAQRHGNIFASWFTYDDKGNPIWYTVPNCVMPSSSLSCSGSVYQVKGPYFFSVDFDPSMRVTTAVGNLSVSFADNNNATMSYTVNGVSRTVSITREMFSTSMGGPAVDYTDMWWNPNEPGWGAAITQQADTIFVAWYVYNPDMSGNPIWFVAPDCEIAADGASCGGAAYQVKGPPFGTTFDPKQVVSTNVGQFRLTFDDANHGTFNYLGTTIFVSKTITRMLF